MSQSRTTEILEYSMGGLGGQYVTGTDATTPSQKFVAIQALEETVVSATTGSPDIDGATIPAGVTVYGKWTSITLTSGKAIFYEGT